MLNTLSYSPSIHPTVDNRIVHRVTHRQPVNDQIDFLDVAIFGQTLVLVGHQEESMLREPAYPKYHDHHDHHFHDL